MKRTVALMTMAFFLNTETTVAADKAVDTAVAKPKCTTMTDAPHRGSAVRVATVDASAGAKDAAAVANQFRCSFQIPPKPLAEALKLYSKQAAVNGAPVGHSISLDAQSRSFLTQPLHGTYGVAEAAQMLLRDSRFIAKFTRPNRIVVIPDSDSGPKDPLPGPSNFAPQTHVTVVKVDGTRPPDETIDPPDGTEADVTIGRHDIEQWGTDLVSLLNRLVPANLSHANRRQSTTVDVGQSQVDLRGLGAEETLVLLEGRRVDARLIGGARGQDDIIGAIPAAAVERIEILPASASGVFGGGATAGVINIVLRRDCPEGRVVASYGNSFRADTLNRSLFASSCLKLFGGRTQLSFSANEAEESLLQTRDRDFVSRGRQEILRNNPSFIIGGVIPPVGAQTNVRSADGSGLAGPGTPAFLTVPDGYTRSKGLAPLFANSGFYNLDLANTSQLDGGGGSVMRSGPHRRYLNGHVSHEFFERLTGYADFTSSEIEVQDTTSIAPTALTGVLIPKGAPGNVFDQAVYVSVPAVGGDGPLESHVGIKRLATGVDFQTLSSWKAGFEFTHTLRKQDWSLSVGRPMASAVISGELDVFHDLSQQSLALSPFADTLFAPELVSRASAFSLRTEGALARLSAGSVMLRGMLEHRRERFDGGIEYIGADTATATPKSLLTPQSRQINSAYVEIRTPVGTHAITRHAATGPARLPRFELQLAGRFDEYVTDTALPRVDARSTDPLTRQSSEFDTVNPAFGFQFRPFSRLTFRANVGTGFVPPSGDQLAPPARRLLPRSFRDPKRGNEPVGRVDFLAGGNPTLQPEHSHSWSLGLKWSRGADRGLQASLDYLEITKTDNIVSPADLAMTNLGLFEDRHPERVIRQAAAAGDPYGVGPITSIDASDINVAQAKIRAWDLDVRYQMEPNRLGEIDLLGHVTWQPEFSTRATPDSPAENDVAVTANAPLRLGAGAEVRLTRGPVKYSWATRYYGPYQVSRNPITLLNQGGRKVGHQTYHDFALTYELPWKRLALDGIDLQATVQNVFDKRPPFDAGSFNYFSPFGDPRGAVYAVSFTARF